MEPTLRPTLNPSYNPTMEPTIEPSLNPTSDPTLSPSIFVAGGNDNEIETEESNLMMVVWVLVGIGVIGSCFQFFLFKRGNKLRDLEEKEHKKQSSRNKIQPEEKIEMINRKQQHEKGKDSNLRTSNNPAYKKGKKEKSSSSEMKSTL